MAAAPVNWRSRSLGELVTLTSGQSPSGFKFSSHGTPYYKVDQLGRSRKYLRRNSTPYFSAALPKVPTGSVLIAKRGGAIALNRVRLLTEPSFMDTNIMALTPGAELNSEFLYYWLAFRGLWDIADVTSVPQINNKHIIPLRIQLPSLPEQLRLVAVMRNVDNLVDTLERKIAKKQAIKQGMVQQLLTDKTRLSGWPCTRLSDLIDGLEAGVSVRSSEHASHGAAVLKTSAVGGGRLDPTEAKSVLPADVGRVRRNPVAGSLVISRMNTPALVGEVGYVERDYSNLYLPDRLWLACPKRGGRQTANMRWLGYYLSSESGSRTVRELATGTSGSMKNISKVRLLALEIPTPPLVEQDRIAEALHDVDCAIDLLCDRLSKVRDVKQGMMQELLTGRTRLPARDGVA